MDGRRLLHALIEVIGLVAGCVLLFVIVIWISSVFGEHQLLVFSFVLGSFLILVQQLGSARTAAGERVPWDALAYLGTVREAVAWAAIVGIVVTLALGLSSVGEPPWQFAAIVGPFLGAVAGCWLAIRRRFGSSAPSAS